MTVNVKKTGKLLFWICCAVYLAVFLLFYTPNYMIPELVTEMSGVGLDLYFAIKSGVELISNMLCPLVCGAFLFLCMGSVGKSLLGGITFTVPSLIYSLPYCYLYALSLGYDSVEATLISFGLCAVGGIVSWAHVIAVYFICRSIARKDADLLLRQNEPTLYRAAKNPNRKANISSRISEMLESDVANAKIFDFHSPVIWAVLLASIAELCLFTAIELVSTVSFMIAVDGLFVESEIITIIGTYLFLFIMMLGGFAASFGIKAHLNKKQITDEVVQGEQNVQV